MVIIGNSSSMLPALFIVLFLSTGTDVPLKECKKLVNSVLEIRYQRVTLFVAGRDRTLRLKIVDRIFFTIVGMWTCRVVTR